MCRRTIWASSFGCLKCFSQYKAKNFRSELFFFAFSVIFTFLILNHSFFILLCFTCLPSQKLSRVKNCNEWKSFLTCLYFRFSSFYFFFRWFFLSSSTNILKAIIRSRSLRRKFRQKFGNLPTYKRKSTVQV